MDTHQARKPGAAPDAMSGACAFFGPGFAGDWVRLTPERTLSLALTTPDPWGAIAAFVASTPDRHAVGGVLAYELAMATEPDLFLPPAALPMVHLISGVPVPAAAPTVAPDDTAPLLAAPVEAPDAGRFMRDVDAVRAAIVDGEIFQANISHRLRARLIAQPDLALRLFARLCAAGPAAYAAFLPVEGGAVLSNSPELFLRADGDMLTAEPIKGTIARHADSEIDASRARALRASVKDRAENLMIVDLLRNDLAKVAADHSIAEPALCALRSLPDVHHLYSRVTGRLRPGLTFLDALRAAFPCGSISGAPRRRAMEVIAAIEGEGRGAYCGAVVYLPPGGPHVASVAIRTGVLTDGPAPQLDFRVGGGITMLSDPAAEFAETLAKAGGFRAMVPCSW